MMSLVISVFKYGYNNLNVSDKILNRKVGTNRECFDATILIIENCCIDFLID